MRAARAIHSMLILTALAGGSVLASPSHANEGNRLQDHGSTRGQLELPTPSGPHIVGTVEFHLIDVSRADPWVESKRRELMVSIWYPARSGEGRPRAPYMQPGAAAIFGESLGQDLDTVDLTSIESHAFVNAPAGADAGRYPLVIYSPGGGLPRAMGTVLVEDLASRGYVVVTIDHTYETSVVEFPSGRLEKRAFSIGGETLRPMIAARVADIRFVLDQLNDLGADPEAILQGKTLPEDLLDAIDLSRVGVFGHSAGGFSAFEAMLVDDRIDAAANLDGSLIYSSSRGLFGDVAEKGLDRPFLLMGAGISGPDDRPHTHEWAPDWKRLWDSSTGWKRDLYLPNAEHMSFADHQVLIPQLITAGAFPAGNSSKSIGTADPAQITCTIRTYLAAFFDQHLKSLDREELLNRASSEYPDLQIIR